FIMAPHAGRESVMRNVCEALGVPDSLVDLRAWQRLGECKKAVFAGWRVNPETAKQAYVTSIVFDLENGPAHGVRRRPAHECQRFQVVVGFAKLCTRIGEVHTYRGFLGSRHSHLDEPARGMGTASARIDYQIGLDAS